MQGKSRARELWLIGELKSQLFAINCADVIEMLAVPPVTAVPHMHESVRGVINLRGRILPLVDLRKLMGMPSMREEAASLCQVMDQRAQDHKNWLRELGDSVTQNRKFTLATDPHKCAFGKWYDSYKTSNLLESSLLQKFDAPHREIHALAAHVTELVHNGKQSDALEIIQSAQNGVLSRMLQLFNAYQELIRDTHREIAVIIRIGGQDFGATVDSIQSVEQLKPENQVELSEIGMSSASKLASHAGRRNKTDELVILLDTASMLSTASVSAGAEKSLRLAS